MDPASLGPTGGFLLTANEWLLPYAERPRQWVSHEWVMDSACVHGLRASHEWNMFSFSGCGFIGWLGTIGVGFFSSTVQGV
jgi:hypothetical protein